MIDDILSFREIFKICLIISVLKLLIKPNKLVQIFKETWKTIPRVPNTPEYMQHIAMATVENTIARAKELVENFTYRK